MASYTTIADERFFASVGRLVIAWAHLESFLDIMVNIMHHAFDNQKHEPEIPRALKRKLTYLKRAFARLPVQLPQYIELFAKIEAESDVRHDLIHGFVVASIEGSGTADMIRLVKRSDGWDQKRFTATTMSVMQAANRAQDLCAPLRIWLEGFHETIAKLPERPE